MNIRLVDGPIKTSPAMLAYVERHVHRAIGRFAESVSRVDVHLRDDNGPKGGIDKACTIHAHIPGAPLLVVSDHAEEFYPAIDRASARLKRAISRRLGRRRGVAPADASGTDQPAQPDTATTM